MGHANGAAEPLDTGSFVDVPGCHSLWQQLCSEAKRKGVILLRVSLCYCMLSHFWSFTSDGCALLECTAVFRTPSRVACGRATAADSASFMHLKSNFVFRGNAAEPAIP